MSTSCSHLCEYKHLDDKQREAVCADIQPIWVNAGPGAGKTRVIVERIKYLIKHKNASIDSILALTFTNDAANEMQQRVMDILNKNTNQNYQYKVQCETFHAFCLKILKQYGTNIGLSSNFEILANTDSILKQILKSKNILKYIDDNTNLCAEKIPIAKIKSIISRAKRDTQNATDFEMAVKRGDNIYCHDNQQLMYLYQVTAKIYHEYESKLIEQNKLDFDDLIFKTVELFNSNNKTKVLDIIVKTNKYQHIVIDEFQDTNSIQFYIAKALVLHRFKIFNDFKSIFVVGDHDQTIFSWRGSQNGLIKKFKDTFKNYKEVELNHNYRSTKNILIIANYIINQSNDQNRNDKKMITNASNGNKVIFEECKSDQDEAHFIISILSEIYQEFNTLNPGQPFNLNNTAILYRSTVQTRIIEEKLNQSSLKYIIAGGKSFYQRKEILDIILFLKILKNPKDNDSLIQIIKSYMTLFKGIGDVFIAKMVQYGKEKNMSLRETLFQIKDIPHSHCKINEKTIKKIVDFLQILYKLKKIKDDPRSTVYELIDTLLTKIKYKSHIQTTIKNKNDADDKWQNVEEFKKIAKEFDDEIETKQYEIDEDEDEDDDIKIIANTDKLNDFLQHIALAQPALDNDINNNNNNNNTSSNHPLCNVIGRIQLSTIHKAKGLEWDNVFIIGCNDGQLPHYRSIQTGNQKDIEEERRLTFVAVTRAKKRLFLSYAMNRNDHQNNKNNNNSNNRQYMRKTHVSRFFKECPMNCIQYNRYNNNDKKRRKNIFRKRKRNKKNKENFYIDSNSNNSIVGFSGFQKANKFAFNDIDETERGRKIRAEKAKMVEKCSTGFQIASGANNGFKKKPKKKRGFKPPRMVNKNNRNKNISRQEVEKENFNHINNNNNINKNNNNNNNDNNGNHNDRNNKTNNKKAMIFKVEDKTEKIGKPKPTKKPNKKRAKKPNKKKAKKRSLNEIDEDDKKKKAKNPPKKKRKKNNLKPDPGQQSILSFFKKK